MWGFGDWPRGRSSAGSSARCWSSAATSRRRAARSSEESAGRRRTSGVRFWLVARAAAAGRGGRRRGGARGGRRAGARATRGCATRRVSPWRSLKAEALARLGRPDEALALAREELELARAWGAPGALGRALRVLGERVPQARRRTGGSRGWRRPSRCSTARSRGWSTPRRWRRSARRCGARGGPTEAREPLRARARAGRRVRRAGAGRARPHRALRGRRAAAHRRAGRRRGADGVERRVADLAAGGETNRDIAQALFVTPKTVEVHLSNAYRKLGIRSRRELEGALAADPSTP